ncbi:MAG: sialate O-acetylesterase, partial [Gemmatimonadales bacterium]
AAALSLPRTGQAVTIDIGDPSDIHPRNKQDVGRRLARVAEALAYGKRVEFSGPVYRAHSVRQSRVTVVFRQAGGGLVTHAGTDTPMCFAIAGADRRFVWAQTTIEGDKVIVWNPHVSQPVAVRYAWGDSPPHPCLYNRAGLPAAPFRTDSW